MPRIDGVDKQKPPARINWIRCPGEVVEVESLVFDPDNARLHPEPNLVSIRESLSRYGQLKPLVVRAESRHVVAGNGTLEAAKGLGWTELAVNLVDLTHLEAMGYGLADNRTAELAEWDVEVVSRLARLQQEAGETPIGWSQEQLVTLRLGDTSERPLTVSLSDKFLVPPFSVLDARQGYWQERKRAWLSLGIQSELGRGEQPTTSARVSPEDQATYRTIGGRKDNGLLGFSEQARSHYRKANATPGGSPLEAASLGKDGRTVRGDGRGRRLARTEGSGGPGDLAAGFKAGAHPIPGGGTGKNSGYMFKTSAGDSPLKELQQEQPQAQTGTSIFDPVLCELAYLWFCPPGGAVLDPFAGGSVRGIVAAKLGRRYTGIDLRPEQAKANVEQVNRIVPGNQPSWVVGDAKDAGSLAPGSYDLLFTCPPYADLERYSDDPRDLSTMGYEDFLDAYNRIIASCCEMLKDNRFACFVVGDVRDRKTGAYRGLIKDTIIAFACAGLELYNEAILVTAVGSLPIRVGKQFSGYRKLGKTHQNVLVFIKGNPAEATKACGNVEVADLGEMFEGQIDDCTQTGD